jgi:hypothetical protein
MVQITLNVQDSMYQHFMYLLNAMNPKEISVVSESLPLHEQTVSLTQLASLTAQPSFNTVWDNDEDAEYDRLPI